MNSPIDKCVELLKLANEKCHRPLWKNTVCALHSVRLSTLADRRKCVSYAFKIPVFFDIRLHIGRIGYFEPYIFHFSLGFLREEQFFFIACVMSAWSRIQRLTAVAVGASVGVGTYLYLNRARETNVSASWTTNTTAGPEAKWNFNWDQ